MSLNEMTFNDMTEGHIFFWTPTLMVKFLGLTTCLPVFEGKQQKISYICENFGIAVLLLIIY